MPNTVKELSLEQLREAAEQEGFKYFQQQAVNNPHDEFAQQEFKNYCRQRSIPTDPEVNRLRSLSREQLAAEWTSKGQAIESAEREDYRYDQARVWIASQPAYDATPGHAQALIAEMERAKATGHMADFQAAFENCVRNGSITPKQLPPVPQKIYTEAELRDMPLDELKRVLESQPRSGSF